MNSIEIPILDYSIVFPAYNEEENVTPLVERIEAVTAKLDGTYEIVIVDNGSYDSTPTVLDSLVYKYRSVVVVTLSRNFGYDGAISTGLEYARGKWVIIMDGDQQDPPEVIPQLINKAKEGYSIVYGIRARRTEGWLLGRQIKMFYNLWKRIANIDIPRDAGNFSIISREVVDIINRMPERNKFIRGLRAWTGYPSAGILYQREERTRGKTKFSYLQYVNHAINGLTSFSTVPLRIFTYVGAIGLLLCLLLGLYVLTASIAWLFGITFIIYPHVQGWATLALLVLFGISITLLGLGVIGEYIGRILEEVKSRPNFLVRRVVRASDMRSPVLAVRDEAK